jgi:hypothetical protein
MITGSLDEETRSQSAASLALASEYVVTVMSYRLSCTGVLYNIERARPAIDDAARSVRLAEFYEFTGAWAGWASSCSTAMKPHP